jgi:leucyl aminopeptidase
LSAPRFDVVAEVPSGCAVLGVPVFSDLSTPAGAGAVVDGGYLAQRRFEGQPGQSVPLPADDGTTVVALGVGRRGTVDADALRRAGAALARNAGASTEVATTLLAAVGPGRASRRDGGVGSIEAAAAAVATGIGLGGYRFNGAQREGRPGRVERAFVVAVRARPRVVEGVRLGQTSVDVTCMARDWVNRPPRDLTPTELARLATEAAAGSGAGVEVWDEERIAAERLGGLMGVAAGASEPPRLIRLEHSPEAAVATVALVGKGITFDSGGLSLKPAASMMTMKSDMGGAAAVIGATVAAARLGLPVRVVGWVAATENMPSGTAIHPGDVLVARNGTSIEVLNTDAEGRLVLADALSLAVEESPDAIVDVATLTGGQRVALGDGVAAVMGTDADLVARVVSAGAVVGEPAWELPLVAAYRKQLESEVADLRNVTAKPAASTIMAGLFLKEFTGGRPWAHLDIAAPSWSDSEEGWTTKGGTGWGTRTLLELLRAWPAGAANT